MAKLYRVCKVMLVEGFEPGTLESEVRYVVSDLWRLSLIQRPQSLVFCLVLDDGSFPLLSSSFTFCYLVTQA